MQEEEFKKQIQLKGDATSFTKGAQGLIQDSSSPEISKNLCTREKDFRLSLERKLFQDQIGKIIDLVNGSIAITTSILNIVIEYIETMGDYKADWFAKLDFAACLVFLFIYILKLYVAQHRFQFLISVSSILDLFIIVPIIIISNADRNSKIFFLVTFSRYVRAINFAIVISKYFPLGQTDVDRQINQVFITMTLLGYISSGMYEAIENPYRNDGQLQFHDSLYFVIVTLLTVGYGDEYPKTDFGKIIVLFIIIFTIVLIPKQTNELLRLMSIRSRYRRNDYKSIDVRHILVTGSVGLQALRNFCEELFHQDHGNQATNAVILQSEDPKSEMEQYIQKNMLSLTYLAGDPLDEEDLKRAVAHKAESCILMTNKNSKSALEEDHRNILTALAVKKFVYNMNKDTKDDSRYNIKLVIQLIKPESKTLYFKSLNLPASSDQLIIVEEIKMNLLAKSCFAPGLIACISNLIISAGGINMESFSEEWIKEYAKGMGHEIYRILIQESDFQISGTLNFKKIAEICFEEYAAVVFALEIEVKSQTRSLIRLNPCNFEFKDWVNYNYYLYIICEDETTARKVQKLEMEDTKYERYNIRPKVEKAKREFNLKDNLTGSQALFFNRSSRRLNTIEVEEEVKINLMAANLNSQNNGGPGDQVDLGSASLLKNLRSRGGNDKQYKIETMKSSQLQDSITGQNEQQQNALEKEYDILSQPQSQTEVQIKDQNIKLSNHIVVCGIHSSIYHFILPLRAKYLKSYQQDIVIISPFSSIKREIWETIAKFPRIYLIEGSALSAEVLHQAFIHKADKAVILGHDPTIKAQKNLELKDEMIDAQSIFIYKAIKRINPSLQILTELSYNSNIDFLLPKTKTKHGYNFSTLYAAGEVYIASTIDTLTAQAFYNPHIVTILQQILVGKGEKTERDEIEAEILANFDNKLQQSNLWQIVVPEEYINKTYDKLFQHLLEKGLIAIGLYRMQGATDNKYSYCFTNPDPKTNVTYRDRVFVLGKEIPPDLMLDLNNGKNKIKMINTKSKSKNQSKQAAQANAAYDYYGLRDPKANQGVTRNFSSNVKSPRILNTPAAQQNQPFTIGEMKKNQLEMFKSKDASQAALLIKERTKTDEVDLSNASKVRKDNSVVQEQNENEQISAMEFMNSALEKLESKLTQIENRVASVKKVLERQDSNIKSEIVTVRKEILLEDNDDNN